MIHIPTGGIFVLLKFIFQHLADPLSMVLFGRAYEVSTLYHNHREIFSNRPYELVGNIEYKIIWKPYHLRRKIITPMIWVKAKEGKIFSRLVISVTASNKNIKYQDIVTLLNIDETPVQVALPSIPFRNLKFEGNIVFTPYDDIQTVVVELYDQDNNIVNLHHHSKKRLTPFDRLEVAMGLERGDVEKWGEVFNLEFIEMEIREVKINLIGGQFGVSPLIYQLKRRIFSIAWVVKSIFWSKNLITARQLTTEYSEYLRKEEEFKKWENENGHIQ